MSLYQSITVDAELIKGLIEVDAELITEIRSKSGWDYFDGEYIVIPTAEDQFLETEEKLMRDDVTVTAIPYEEVSNPAGGVTVTIG